MKEIREEIKNQTQEDVARIEVALKENLNPYLEIVSEVASHIMFSGGKRLRPLLTVLCAELFDQAQTMDIHRYAVIFEYLHTATLLHDDLVDDAGYRRGKRVSHAIWGNSVAVLAGDFLMARSLCLAVETGKFELVKMIAEITENMSQGEIHQLINKENVDLTETEYMTVIQNKTAVLIRAACQAGAILMDASPEKTDALRSFGFHLGMAFQMADDLLDYQSNLENLGKESGADLREGKITLPVIHVLQKASADDRLKMEKIMMNKDFTVAEFSFFCDMLHQYGGIQYAYQKAESHVESAKSNLSVFKPSTIKDLLCLVADYAISRKV